MNLFGRQKRSLTQFVSFSAFWIILSSCVLSVTSKKDDLESVLVDDIQPAGSEVNPVSVAEPNLGALLGLRSPITSGSPVALLQGLGATSLAASGGGSLPSPQDSRALANLCNGGGNSEALSNLLVYQYLSGSLPGGNGGAVNSPNPNSGRAINSGNPQLQALLEGTRETRTATSIRTTLTTRTITMDASTKFSTTTTSYVTTVTTLTSSVLPIIFRGSKITTTITDRITKVLTATEFHTSSSVLAPSIIQTLNVEITLTETSTKGLNGHFTLAHVNPGATKVIEHPISSSTVGFDSSGIDLSSLKGLGNNGDKSGVVSALTALLQQYNEEGAPEDKTNEEDSGRNFRNTRFHTRNKEDQPKFNVIRGFTLRDQEPPKKEKSTNSGGSALENTRYSKFLKKNTPKNNSLRPERPDRESERYSASTSRRTVSRNHRRSQRRNTRFQARSVDRTPARVRYSRETNRILRHYEKSRASPSTRSNIIRVSPQKDSKNYKTTLLTMHISGAKPGETKTTVRKVTLRGFETARNRRHIEPNLDISKPSPILQTQSINDFSNISPKEVVGLLQNADRDVVRKMLHNLKDWVDYYLHQVLDEFIEPSFFLETNELEQAPKLYSSQNEEASAFQEATVALKTVQVPFTKESNSNLSSTVGCPKISTVTETVYRTVFVPSS